MKGLILAGGLGTRLRPLTFTRPKHLLPVANRPHVARVFDLLARHGITEVVLLTSYLADAFSGVIADAQGQGVEVAVTREEEPLGTAGALRFAADLVGEDRFVVFNGDILTDCDLGSVLSFHSDRSAEATILLTPVPDPSAFGVVPTDERGRVLGFVEKPPAGQAPTNLINAGVYVFEASVLDRIPPGEVWSAERQLFPGLVDDDADFYALSTDAYWMDIGTPAKYVQANIDALEGRFTLPEGASANGVLIGEGGSVAAGATVSLTCVGPRALIERGATVSRSVLLPGAIVSAGAAVTGSVLGEGASVGAGVTVMDAALADNEMVG